MKFKYEVEFVKSFGIAGKKTAKILIDTISKFENDGWTLIADTVSVQGAFFKREWHTLVFRKEM